MPSCLAVWWSDTRARRVGEHRYTMILCRAPLLQGLNVHRVGKMNQTDEAARLPWRRPARRRGDLPPAEGREEEQSGCAR